MDSRQAKEILTRYRPGTDDATDPEVAEALEQSRRDPELGRWFEQHLACQTAIRERLRQLPVPAGLKEKILAGKIAVEMPDGWPQPVFQVLAAAAMIALTIGLAWFWLQPGERKGFAAFQNRMVRNAQRGYTMEITTTNLDEIRRYLAAHEARADYVLPAALEKLPGDGGAVLRWQNKKVAMVCFDSGNHNELYLFVVPRSDLPDAPVMVEPQFSRIGKLTAASWSAGDKTYVLAGNGDEQFLRKYLGP